MIVVPRHYENRKTILVTGSAGFWGSHLIGRLLADGNEGACVGNFFTGPKRNIELLSNDLRFEFIRHDVAFPLCLGVGAINILGLAKHLSCKILQAFTGGVYGNPEIDPPVESCWGTILIYGDGSQTRPFCYVDELIDSMVRTPLPAAGLR